MSKSIQLIALDLDGTLLDSAKEISPANQAAIREAVAAGIEVVLTTGRPLIAIAPYLATLGLTGSQHYTIAFNGGLVQRNDGEILDAATMSWADVKAVKALTSHYDLPCDLLEGGDVYITDSRSEYATINKWLRFHSVKFDDIPESRQINKIVSCTTPETLDAALSRFPEDILSRFEIFKTQAKLLEFMPKGVDKARGLSRLTGLLGLTADNVLAMGDEMNDLPMLTWAGTGVAMGNAVPAVKASADIVSSHTNDEDAVAAAIRSLALGE